MNYGTRMVLVVSEKLYLAVPGFRWRQSTVWHGRQQGGRGAVRQTAIVVRQRQRQRRDDWPVACKRRRRNLQTAARQRLEIPDIVNKRTTSAERRRVDGRCSVKSATWLLLRKAKC